MSDRKDLTRWNRAGRSRFTYVDGNAVEYLEILRQQLADKFKDTIWLEPSEPIPVNEEKVKGETLLDEQKRLHVRGQRILEMYHQDRRDWAWEITRTFARACHILTGYADAWANEGYLGTATQWDNVRRLVEMLDYHPAPPASASTWLTMEAKTLKSGLLNQGWQVKYKPPEGGDKVVFETLDDIEIDSALNWLYVKDWNKSQAHISEAVVWTKENGDSIEALDISGGDIGVLLHAEWEQGKAVAIADVDHAAGTMAFAFPGFSGAESWPEHQVELLVGAKDVRAVKISGEGVIEFDQAPGLSVGDVIWWSSFGSQFNEVSEVDGTRIRLVYPGAFPGIGDVVYRLNRIGKTSVAPFPPNTIIFPLEYKNVFGRKNGVLENIMPASGECPVKKSATDEYSEITDSAISEIYVRYGSDAPISQQVKAVNPADFVVSGAAKGFRSGDWVIGASEDQHFALQIESIDERENDFVIRFTSFAASPSMSPTVISESLGSALRKIQVSMDEDVLYDKKLAFFIDGDADDLPVTAIQGVGDSYAGKMIGISTIRDLMEMSATSIAGFSDIRLRQFKTKAEMILNLEATEEALALSDHTVYELLETFSGVGVTVTPGAEELGTIQRIHGPLQYVLRPENFARNADTLAADNNIELATLPGALPRGRTVLLECNGETLVSEVEALVGGTTVKLRDRVKADTFIKADTKIYANVARAGHGERKPEKILGSGDAANSNQGFTLEVKDVSFIPDATKSSGVAAAIEVEVAGRVWEQVSALKDSAPVEHHYAIRMTEEGYVRILFGDGQNGRRLPSGKNNVRVRYRVGSGLAGNVIAHSLEKPVNKHPLVDSVLQPAQATGGGDMEDASSLQENAPSTLLAFERAVSLSDFADLATGRSNIWQAKARSEVSYAGQKERVQVIVVPADGVSSPEMIEDVRKFLQAHALPGVQVTVENFNPVLFDLKVTARIKTDEFISAEVERAVTSALLDHFKLKNRKLGGHLYLSEVYKIVEGVQGVENSICVLNDNEQQVIKACDEGTVVYLDTDADTDPSILRVAIEEYRP